jgi:hypothetical protein
MGSGLIYIIIVGMWIAYFLPRWIANHDEVSGRSVDKFNEAMRVVGKASGKSKVDLEELLKRKENQMLVRRIVFFSILGLMTICGLFILVGFLSPTIILLPISVFILLILVIKLASLMTRSSLLGKIQKESLKIVSTAI